jgi:Sap, sulfolipid-1-addressing protein
MWGSVLALALLFALNPVRLGVILLLISRPRPVPNLLAYWVGNLTASIPAVGVPLTLLHVTPMFRSFTKNLPTSPTVRHIQIGMGVLALSIAALITVRSLMRARQRAHLPTPGGNTSTLVLDSNTPPAISRLLGRMQDAPTEGGSAIRRLLGRVHNAWKNGSLWVAFVIGIGFAGAPPDVVLFVLAIIVPSGATIGTQLSAVIVFVVGMIAVVEITLVSYLAMPAKTQAVLRLLHDWAWAHRRTILVAMCTVGGVSLVARGMGGM